MLKPLLATVTLTAAMLVATPTIAQGDNTMITSPSNGRVSVNGVELYYEVQGDGAPLVMLHGGVNPSDFFGAPMAEMARNHKVIAIHLRGHGLSTDTDAPLTSEQMADDVAVLLGELGLDKVPIMGWSMGGGVAYQTAIRHPDLVSKLVVVSMSVRNDANFPEVKAAFDAMPQMAAQIAQNVSQSPLATLYPDVNWETLFLKTGEMNRTSYDWSADIAKIAVPTLVVFADADMMPPEHMIEIYKLLGGGTRDAGVDGSARPTQNQLAIIPGTTHYDLPTKAAKTLAAHATAFLAE